MTDKEKDLLLKTLSSMLPYGVMLKTDNVFPQKLEGISFDKNTFLVWVSDGGFKLENMECKPYLFPMSSMTEEQRKNWFKESNVDYDCEFHIEPTISIDFCHLSIDWLNKNHFDYRGLISKGLAIDATKLNIY